MITAWTLLPADARECAKVVDAEEHACAFIQSINAKVGASGNILDVVS